MSKHADFIKIEKRFLSQYKDKGNELYQKWLADKGYDDTKPLSSQKKEKKEKTCSVLGVEIKETDIEYYVSGLIATTHIDDYDQEPTAAGIPDKVTEATIDYWIANTNYLENMICGIHHSEGRTGDYGGNAVVARKVDLPDGEKGLYVETRILKDDPIGMQIKDGFEKGELNSFSITYDTKGMSSVDFDIIDDRLVRLIMPGTELFGYTAASNPVNPNALALGYGYKEFKAFMVKADQTASQQNISEEQKMVNDDLQKVLEAKEAKLREMELALEAREREAKEKQLKEQFEKELKEKVAEAKADAIKSYTDSSEFKAKIDKLVEEKAKINGSEEMAPELKAFISALESKEKSPEYGFKAAGTLAYSYGLLGENGEYKTTSRKEGGHEFKSFATNGRFLEFKGLSIGSNATAYTQSQTELDDVYDPMIWNLLNQGTMTWNFLDKEDYSGKGNNHVQFRVKTGVNATRGFYTGNEVTTGKGTRAKYQTKFKKIKVGVEIDGDMMAAARGSSIGDVWNVEIASAAEDLLSLMNSQLFAETGLETAAEPIGFEYITDSAGNTTLYNTARTAANGLAPTTATDTYINGGSGYTMTLARSAITHCIKDGSNKADLFFVCDPTVGDIIRASEDSKRRHADPRMTRFGFETDLYIDGVPVLEDKDCNDDDLFLVDKRHHKIAIWLPPTLELLGKRADADEGFIKCYYAPYNTAPRRMVQIYGITGLPA